MGANTTIVTGSVYNNSRVALKQLTCGALQSVAHRLSIRTKGLIEMARLLITFGGSHRKYDKQRRAFEDAGIELDECGAASLGSKLRHGIVSDTTEARALIKEVGASVARKQWKFLREGD